MLSNRSIGSSRPNPHSERNPFAPQAQAQTANYYSENQNQRIQGQERQGPTSSSRTLNYSTQLNANLELQCIIGFSNTYRECVVAIPGNRNYYLKSFGSFMVLEDVDNRQNQILLRDHDMQISAVEVSPSGQYFASGQEGSFKRGQVAPAFLWSLAPDLKRLTVLAGLSMSVNLLKFSLDEHFVCGCGDDCQLIIWDTSTGEIIYCEKTPKPIYVLTWFSPTEVAYACDNHLFVFKLKYDNYSCQYVVNREQLAFPPSNQFNRTYTCVATSIDNSFVYFGTTAGEVLVFKLDARIMRCNVAVCSHGVNSLKVLPSGEILCGGGDGSINLLLGQDKSWQLQLLTSLEGRVISLSLMNGSEFLVSTAVGHVYRCNVQVLTRKCGQSLLTMSHTNPVSCLQSIPNTPIVFSGTTAGEVLAWDMNTFRIIQLTRRPKSGAVLCLYVVPDYGVLSGWSDGSIVCFKLNDLNNQMWSLPNSHRDGTTSIYVYSSSTTRFIVTGGNDGTVRIWKLENREMVTQYNGHSMKPVTRVLVDHKCNFIVHSLGADGSVASYDLKSNKFIMTHQGGTSACDLTQRVDSELELISCDVRGSLSVWDIDARDPVLCIEDPSKVRIRVCAVSPSGRFVAFAGDEKRVKILDLRTFEIVSVGDSHSESISCLIWSADEKQIYSGGDDCCLSIWNLLT